MKDSIDVTQRNCRGTSAGGNAEVRSRRRVKDVLGDNRIEPFLPIDPFRHVGCSRMASERLDPRQDADASGRKTPVTVHMMTAARLPDFRRGSSSKARLSLRRPDVHKPGACVAPMPRDHV